ncbi:tetratricopeptide repeat protein [Streptomyces sp. HSG2]|uniref:tetratricopeptide repeat protein n=1 Tax=Streptomyces sp. HSG2 TaxID=2797167 RepID=UPI001905656F
MTAQGVLARVQVSESTRRGAGATLTSVPRDPLRHAAARVVAVRAGIRRDAATRTDVGFAEDLKAAAEQVEALTEYGLDPARRERSATEVLVSALDWILSGGRASTASAAGARTSLGSTLGERGSRFGPERAHRAPARPAEGGEERNDLVERANRYRPRTWV